MKVASIEMRWFRWFLSLWLAGYGLFTSGVGTQWALSEPVISELMAQNQSGYSDDDRDRSDWIELFNPDSTAWDLEGWALTDDPDDLGKWVFPKTTIHPGSYLVVLASGKDRRVLGAPLHTSFRLSGRGEFLGLVNSEGRVVFSFEPSFPDQTPDVSYGIGQSRGEETILLGAGAPTKALIPIDNGLGNRWQALEFDDTDWLSGRTAVGYDYSAYVKLDVGAMRGTNPSVYIRVPFSIDNPAGVDRLILRMRYEDGFVAYLNGQRIADGNAPRTVSWNSTASADRPDGEAVIPVDIDITSAKDLLKPGSNLLAIHGLNRAVSSSDILCEPELISVKAGAVQNAGFIFAPTPGGENRSGVQGVVASPQFSIRSQVFVRSLALTLALPEGVSERAEIRFSLDGTIPSSDSTLYTDPISITTTTQVRARVFDSSGAVSVVSSETFIEALPEVADFSSDLPLIVLENFRGGRPPQNGFQTGAMAIIEPSEGSRSQLVGVPNLHSRVGLKVRGSSTSGRPKPSLSLEARDEYDEGHGIAPLGLPRDSDWVLWGPYNFDLTLIHNPFIYELSNRIGRYAPRTRFVEVFLNTGGGPLRSNDYFGVYALTEKIKRDDDRVDVDKLFSEHDRQPMVEGGYVLKVDRADPGDSGFSQAGQTIRYVYPKETLIERPERNAQEQFIRNYFRDMGRALNSSNFKDLDEGYAKYIDVDAAIDHHLLNVLAFNVDALRLSGYMHLPRGGKLTFGPIWDFDRALGSTDGRDNNPRTWRSRSGDRGTDFFNYPWWNRMFRDIDFFQRYIDRFQQLRRGVFSDSEMNRVVDGMADELREAQRRNLDRWNQRPRSQYGRTYQGEINHMKDWLADRAAFMESQFVAPPVFSSAESGVASGDQITISAVEGAEIYYTVDGLDPRESGGGLSRSAIRYDGPMTIERSTRLVARIRHLEHRSLTGANNPPLRSHWSGPVSQVYSIDAQPGRGDLEFSEIHYHPAPPREDERIVDANLRARDFEFLEVKNRTDRSLDLRNLKLVGGVSYAFPSDTVASLAPGGVLLFVSNRQAFELRYGRVQTVMREFQGALNNDEDSLQLLAGDGTVLLELSYEDHWYPSSDGLGFSLVLNREASDLGEIGDAARYGPSPRIGGSPGSTGERLSVFPKVVVSEVLNNSTVPEVDSIELTNLGAQVGNLSYWYLTDDLTRPRKYQIPNGTRVESGTRLVFREDDFGSRSDLSEGFGLSSRGDEVYLVSGDSEGNLTGYVHGFSFGPLPSGDTQGPWVDSTGTSHIVPFEVASLGEENSNPRISPVVVSEVFAAPTTSSDSIEPQGIEFIELFNRMGSTVLLGESAGEVHRWRIRGGIRFDFPERFELGPQHSVVIVDFDPKSQQSLLGESRDYWGVPNDTVILGPFSGRLENSGDTVRLERTDPSLVFDGEPEYLVVDAVQYLDEMPWPEVLESVTSLQRVSSRWYANDPANWNRGFPNPGHVEDEASSEIVSISWRDDGIYLEIEVGRSGHYGLEFSPDLGRSGWSLLQEFSLDAVDGLSTTVVDRAPASEQRFYRISSLSALSTD